MVWKFFIKEILGVHCICVNRNSFLSGDIRVPLTLFWVHNWVNGRHYWLDLILVNIWNITTIELSCNNHLSLLNGSRGSRWGGGGPGTPPPPLKFVRDGVLCRGLMGRRGGPTIVFTLLLSLFFLARFARQYYTNMFSMEQSSFFFCPLSKLWIESNFPSLAFMKLSERVFLYFSCLELNDFTPYKPKIFWGRTPRPPPHPRHINDIKTTLSSVCLCTEAFNCTKKKTFPTDNKLECK